MTKDEFLTCLVRQAGGAEPLSREEEQKLGKMIKYGTSGWKKFAWASWSVPREITSRIPVSAICPMPLVVAAIVGWPKW